MRRALLPLLLALALTGLCVPAAQAAPLGRATEGKLDRALGAAFAKTRSPGAIAGVWVGGKGWTAVRGTAVRGKRIAPTLADHTRIGSVTKTFVGTLVLQLVDRRRLRLDESIERWFPRLPDAGSITIRQLGEMSSGINTYTADEAVRDRYLDDPTTVWRPSRLIAAGLALPRVFPPGEGFFYSDTNTLMLGKIVEAVTGKPLGRLLRERIFAPLGLRGTSYPSSSRLPDPYWNGYTDQDERGEAIRDSTDWSPSFAGAAGKIVSTLPDLRRWAVALGTGSLISPAAQRQRLRPNPASVEGGREYDFCLGRDHGWLTHTGDLPGYNTTIAYLPKRRAAIVVLTNTDAEAGGADPTPAIFSALARVIAPGNVPTGTH